MSRPVKILAIVGACLAGLVVVLIVAALITIQTPWFTNFAKNKIISSLEESTGGTVQIGSLDVDLGHLTIRMRNAVLHGTEPKNVDPLLQIALLELRLKLFSGIAHLIDLNYLGVDQPRVNLLMMTGGSTNIPQPKTPQPSSNANPLQTVIDLKVNRFDIQNGLIKFLDQQTPFSAQGQNLRALLTYNTANPSYSGNVAVDPLLLASGPRPPLNVKVNIPVSITKSSITLANASLNTAQSRIGLTLALNNPDSPVIGGSLIANISLPELQRSFDLPVGANAQGAPTNLTADLALRLDTNAKSFELQRANVALGQTTFSAMGKTGPRVNGNIRFQANLALLQLSKLLQLKSMQLAGDLRANGNATLDAQYNYFVNGNIDSSGLAVTTGATRISDVHLSTPFHVDPYLISINGLKLNVLGGSLAAKMFIEKMQQMSVEANLTNFSLPVLASAFAGRRLGYDGTITGSLQGRGDLKAKGMTGYSAEANLAVLPGSRGVPLNGRLHASYVGKTGAVDLGQSYLALPNSRLDVAGTLNTRIDLKLVSHNLNDFLPAINFESATPETSLPVTLRGGAATMTAQVTGNLANPHIDAQLAMNRFAVEQHPFDALALNIAASPSGASIQNGSLTAPAMQTNFSGSIGLVKWQPVAHSPVAADLTIRSGNISDLLSLAGESSIEASGLLTSEVHIYGTYGDPLGNAVLQVVNGSIDNQPFSRLYGSVNLAHQLITLSNLELDTASGSISATAAFQHPADSFLTGRARAHLAIDNIQLAKVVPLQQKEAVSGLIQLTADTAMDVTKQGQQTALHVSNVSGDLSASSLKLQNQNAGNLTGSARTANGTVTYQLASDFAGSNVRVNGHTGLNDPYPTVADASIQNLSIGKVLEITGQTSIPATGQLSAGAHVSGNLNTPDAKLEFNLSHANVYQEPIDRLQGSLQYSNTLLTVSSIDLRVPAGSVNLSGAFTHPANDFKTGALALKVNSTPIQVAKIVHVANAEPGINGTLRIAADLSARILPAGATPALHFSSLNANAALENVSYNSTALGGAALSAQTQGQNLHFQLDSDLAKSQIHGSGQAQLSGDYPLRANLSFANLRYSNFTPLFNSQGISPVPVDAEVQGDVTVNGPILKPDTLSGRLQLTTLEVETNPQGSPTGGPPARRADLRNQGPIVVALDRSVLKVDHFHITGPNTNISASGGFSLKNTSSPLGITVGADINLGVLQDIDPDFYSSGGLTMNATFHGTLSQPLASGRIELKNANINYVKAPNGLSNGNGVILLNGTSATIQTLTGQSGGGTVSASGFVGFSGSALTFNLKANANKVRVLYSGIGIVSNANVALIGTTRRSLLNGTVSVTRLSYTSTSDAGSLLSNASTPPSTPTAPSPLLSGMHLDVHILTAPDMRVISTYTDSLDVIANLSLRGTAEMPGILGRITVTNGRLVFFGNTYTVDTGSINFYDPNSIEPVLNISLETVAQGVSVVIGVSGPIEDLKLTYRSDPPLTFQQIVQLLATNTTPANPIIAAQQPPAQQQSFSQMGESALLGQAVANPLASRVQRVFGLSELKIDPSFSGTNGQPNAQLTLQQKIASNITFTYITDVTQTNGQIIRLQWDMTNKLSLVGLRDYNGNVSIELFYKFTKR